MTKLLFYHFWATNSRLENKKFHFELLAWNWKIESSSSTYSLIGKLFFFTFEILTRSWKVKIFLCVTYSKNEITKSRFRNRLRFLYWNEILHNLELFEKNVGMLDFVILDINLALNRYCLWSWDYSAHALRYAIVFFEKKLLFIRLFCFIKYVLFI